MKTKLFIDELTLLTTGLSERDLQNGAILSSDQREKLREQLAGSALDPSKPIKIAMKAGGPQGVWLIQD